MKNNRFDGAINKVLPLYLLKLIHFLVGLVLFSYAWILFRYGGFPAEIETGFRYNLFVILGYGVCVFFLGRIYNAYLLGYNRVRALTLAQAFTQLFSLAITYFVVSIAWNRFRNPAVFLALLVLQFLWDALWSMIANKLFFRLNHPKRAILIYRSPQDLQKVSSVLRQPDNRLYRIEQKLAFDGSFPELMPQLEGFDAVIVTGVNSSCRNGILKYCQENDVLSLFVPHLGDLIVQQARHIQAFDSPVMTVRRKTLNPEYAIIKRAFDMLASLLGLVILSPLLLLTIVAIKLCDGGPVFYRQTRLTKDGKEFQILKFRSMRVDAEKDGSARLSTDNDDRITPVGRFLRKCRLDELPQLWNILRGDMSFVGPRPERPEIAAIYSETISAFPLRLQVKAGLTGYAQVYGKYNTGPYEKLEFDLLYIKNMSVLTDIRLLFATVSVLFSPESTEGIQSGQTNALHMEAADETEDVPEPSEPAER
jgi:exopolysaccharide biosynthesis polyprenyl glycosylphosphotransferase